MSSTQSVDFKTVWADPVLLYELACTQNTVWKQACIDYLRQDLKPTHGLLTPNTIVLYTKMAVDPHLDFFKAMPLLLNASRPPSGSQWIESMDLPAASPMNMDEIPLWTDAIKGYQMNAQKLAHLFLDQGFDAPGISLARGSWYTTLTDMSLWDRLDPREKPYALYILTQRQFPEDTQRAFDQTPLFNDADVHMANTCGEPLCQLFSAYDPITKMEQPLKSSSFEYAWHVASWLKGQSSLQLPLPEGHAESIVEASILKH